MIQINLDILSSASQIRLYEALSKIAQYDSHATRIEAEQWKNDVAAYYKEMKGQSIEAAVKEKHEGIAKLHPKQ